MKDITVGTMININVHGIVLFYLHTAVKKTKLLMSQRRYNKKNTIQTEWVLILAQGSY